MRFLKILFWVLIAVFATILAAQNWHSVTVNLWSDLILDIKLPLLVALTFLAGFLPTWAILRGRVWQLTRRVESQERIAVARSSASDEPATSPDTRPEPAR